MHKIMSFLLSLVFAGAPVQAATQSPYALLTAHYPQPKECYADKHKLSLVPQEGRRVALGLLATNDTNNRPSLLKNSPHAETKLFGDDGVIASIDKTQTSVGHAAFVSMLAHPNKQQLQSRQNMVRIFAQNSQLADELTTQIKRFAEAEALFLTFYRDSVVTPESSVSSWTGFNKKISLVGSVANMCGIAVPLPGPAALIAAVATLGTWGLYRISSIQAPWINLRNYGRKLCMPFQLHNNYQTIIGRIGQEGVDLDAAQQEWRNASLKYCAIWFAAACWGLYTYSKTLTEMSAQQVSLRALKAGLSAAEEISRILDQDPRLAQSMPELKALKTLFDPNEHGSEFKRLLINLQEGSFKEPFCASASFDAITTAHQLMGTSARLQLRNAFEAIGKIDAYLAASTLITEGVNGAHYNFVKWANRGGAYVKFVDLYNPVNPAQRISFELRGNSKHVLGRNQNEAAVVATALMLAHAFGITPARETELSPLEDLVVLSNTDTDAHATKSAPLLEVAAHSPGVVIIDHAATESADARTACLQAVNDCANNQRITIVTTNCPHVATKVR
jgi:hypothetical protein